MNRNLKTIRAEILAPAAGFESVKGAISAGADAVYIGGKMFGARAYADNMEKDELLDAIDYVHLHDRQLYMTVNTLLKEHEIENMLYEYLCPYYERGLDAVIVQDIGVMRFIKKQFPGLAIHASTQMTITGAYAPQQLYQEGIERIVTARELSLEEIAAIHQAVPDIEIESFVHGALCMGYSGQCFFSSFLGGRSGNRGRCAQSCRLPYGLYDAYENKLSDEKRQAYLLSPKDMCTIDLLPEILQAGVFSLKIEGRMKRPEYTAGVTAIYRKYLDLYLKEGNASYQVSDEDRQILMDLYNRGSFCQGYYKEHNNRNMMSMSRPNHHGVKAGVLFADRQGVFLKAETELSEKDVLEIRHPDFKVKNEANKYQEISLKQAVQPGGRIRFDGYCKGLNIRKGQTIDVYRMRNEKLLQDISAKFLKEEQKIKINGELVVKKGEPLALQVWCEDIFAYGQGECVELAVNSSATVEQLEKGVRKTGNTAFLFDSIRISLEDGCYVPVKVLNELRRRVLEELEQNILAVYHRNKPTSLKKINLSGDMNHDTPVISCYVAVTTEEQLQEVLKFKEVKGCYVDMQLFLKNRFDHQKQWQELTKWTQICDKVKMTGKKIYLSLPMILRKESSDKLMDCRAFLVKCFDGVLVHNYEQLIFVKKMLAQFQEEQSVYEKDTVVEEFEIIADYMLYDLNSYADDYLKELKVTRTTYSVELNERELIGFSKHCVLPKELLFYGYLPMMFTAQCQAKNMGRCTGETQQFYMKDRKGKNMTVQTNCAFCYNTIYNSEPLSMSGLEEKVYALAPEAVRLQFTIEDSKTTRQRMEEFVARFYNRVELQESLKVFTRGHFKRGVE